jgi:ketosteroid isomerase-like protein
MAASGAEDARRAKIDALFAAIDAMDTAAFLEYLTDDATFRFGSSPPVEGREAIGAAVGGFYSTIAALEHRLGLIMGDADTIVCEGETTYTRHDGSQLTVPFADVFDMDGDKIKNYKIYADITALYA